MNISANFLYGKCFFAFIFMQMSIVLSVIIGGILYLVRKKKDYLDYMFLSVNVIYETLYSNIVNLLSKSISCREFGKKKFYSSQNLEISCDDMGFLQWVFFFSFNTVTIKMLYRNGFSLFLLFLSFPLLFHFS